MSKQVIKKIHVEFDPSVLLGELAEKMFVIAQCGHCSVETNFAGDVLKVFPDQDIQKTILDWHQRHHERLYHQKSQATWLPIESAPKDGSELLVTSPMWYRPCFCFWWNQVGQWYDLKSREPHVTPPTHWLPIPPIPGE